MKVEMSIFASAKEYDSPHAWPAGTFLQAGDDGIVLAHGSLSKTLTDDKVGASTLVSALVPEAPQPSGSYRTAFFEAFPRKPDTFIRGEGRTVAEADADAFRQFQKFAACPKHQFQRRSYRNGAGFCRRCGMFKSKVFSILDRCRYNCGSPAYSFDKDRRGYCRKHDSRNPQRFFDTIDGKRVLRSAAERGEVAA